jgi:hypothetical protein
MTTPSPSDGGESVPSFGGAGVAKNKLQSPKNPTDILQYILFKKTLKTKGFFSEKIWKM